MQTLSRDRTFGNERRYRINDPALTVEPGETFAVETVTARAAVVRSAEDLAGPALASRQAGPVYVRDVLAGDSLAVRIESIVIHGHAYVEPTLAGSLGGEGGPVFVEVENDALKLPGARPLAAAPTIPDIYVTPASPDVNDPWDHGGRLGFDGIATGAVLHLVAQRPGGMLALGGVSALKVPGQIGGVGAQCAATVTLTVTKDERPLSPRPFVETDEEVTALGVRPEAWESVMQAVADLVGYLAFMRGMQMADAVTLISAAGRIRAGALWSLSPAYAGRDVPVVVGLTVPKSALE